MSQVSLFDSEARVSPARSQLLDLLGALEDVHGLPDASSAFTLLRDVRFRPQESIRSTPFRRVLVPGVVQGFRSFAGS